MPGVRAMYTYILRIRAKNSGRLAFLRRYATVEVADVCPFGCGGGIEAPPINAQRVGALKHLLN